jgi:protein CpxP
MKKNLLYAAVVFAVLMGGSAVYGQDQGGGQKQPMTAEQRLQKMTKQLNLTDEQKQQIMPILENEQKEMQAVRQDSSLSRSDRMSKMQQLRQDTSSQIKPVLNQDQQQKYEQTTNRQGQATGQPKLQ